MTLLHIFVLAIVQGITEFFPISSSGHLLFIAPVTGWPDQGLVLDIAVHVGSLGAVVLYFWRDIAGIAQALLTPHREESAASLRLFGHVIIASIPAVIIGAFLFLLLSLEFRSLLLVAITTIVFGVMLGWADKKYPAPKTLQQMTAQDAFVIGLLQIFALIPGTSRSGVTMMAARMRGINRTDGAHFSILLSIPTILGAGTLAGVSLYHAGDVEIGLDAVLAAGISFIVALCAIGLLMRWIDRIGYTPFIIYRLIFGVLLIRVYFFI